MYEIEVLSRFSAAHHLRGYKGKCENIHGHNWKVSAIISSDILDEIGMAADFSDVKKKLNIVLQNLDHKDLNNVPYFKKVNPTSENLAGFIYKQLRKEGLSVSSVSVWESDDCRAVYSEK